MTELLIGAQDHLHALLDCMGAGGAVIRQGKYRLATELLEGRGQPLRAPAQGVMGRTIHESLRSSMRFRLWQGERLLLDHTDPWASFEYAAG